MKMQICPIAFQKNNNKHRALLEFDIKKQRTGLVV
jgi:hypothetical protein